MQVKDIMTSDVVTLKPDELIREVIIKFGEKHISGAPVVNEDDEVIGIVSEDDLLKSLRVRYKELRMVYPALPIMGISFIEEEKKQELFEALKEIGDSPVSEVMTKKVITVSLTDSVETVIPIMVKEKVNRLPVVDKHKKIVGIISRGDIIKGLMVLKEKK